MLTEVKNQLKVSFLSIKYSAIRAMTNKKSFLFSVLLMFVSNASFLVQWTVILSVSSSSDLSMKEILMVWGFAATSFGLANIIFGGAMFIPYYIEDGKLDAYLVQPKSVLLNILNSHCSMSAFGDLIYGYLVILIASPSIKTFIYLTLFSVCGAITYTSFIVILYSLLFFSLNFRELSDTLIRVPTSFSTYPEGIFKGFIKILLYTVFPVALIVYFPVKSLLTNNPLILLIVGFLTVIISLFSFLIFNLGLKKYSSTNLMGSRT